MTCRNILKPISFMALLCASTGAASQSYMPVSDGLLDRIQLSPENAAAVTAMCDERLAAGAKLRAEMEAMPVTADPRTLFAAYDDLYNLMVSTAYTEPNLLQNVHDDAEVRKAAADCQTSAGAALTAMFASEAIFARLKIVQAANQDPAMGWTLARQVDNFRRAGVDLDETTRAKVGALLNEINELSIEFDANIAKDVRNISVDAKDLAGLPDDFVAQFAPDADGKVTLPVTGATLSPIMRYAENADLRQRMLTEFASRAYPQNDTVLAQVIARRAEFAELMGHPHYAAFDFANRMANDAGTVQAFLDDIAAAARPIAEEEIDRLLARLQQDDPSLTELNQWSTSRAATLIRTEEYATDPKVIREYFAYDKVRAGISA